MHLQRSSTAGSLGSTASSQMSLTAAPEGWVRAPSFARSQRFPPRAADQGPGVCYYEPLPGVFDNMPVVSKARPSDWSRRPRSTAPLPGPRATASLWGVDELLVDPGPPPGAYAPPSAFADAMSNPGMGSGVFLCTEKRTCDISDARRLHRLRRSKLWASAEALPDVEAPSPAKKLRQRQLRLRQQQLNRSKTKAAMSGVLAANRFRAAARRAKMRLLARSVDEDAVNKTALGLASPSLSPESSLASLPAPSPLSDQAGQSRAEEEDDDGEETPVQELGSVLVRNRELAGTVPLKVSREQRQRMRRPPHVKVRQRQRKAREDDVSLVQELDNFVMPMRRTIRFY